MKYPHIAARLFDQPLLIESGKLATIVAALGPRFDPDLNWGMVDSVYARPTEVSETGYTVMDGIAIIPVIGALVQRGSYPDAMSGLTGYDALSEWFQVALLDPGVKSIMLELDSPGGEVAGAFDFADQIYAARGQKRIVAMVSDLAASAGYLIASAADEIVTTRTGKTGSVGVVTAHLDLSRAAASEGVVITHIYAGAHKIDGNPYTPLPDDVRVRVQADIDSIYGLFVQTVARNRGLTDAAVRATEALTYLGEAAITAGFVDKVATREATLAAMSMAPDRMAGRGLKLSGKFKESRMENDDASRSSAETDEALMAATVSEARSQERARIRAIMQSETAVGRTEMAEHLAFETDMEVSPAIALLGKAPVVQAESIQSAATGAMARAMADIEQPNISALRDDDPQEDSSSRANAAIIIKHFKRATGKK